MQIADTARRRRRQELAGQGGDARDVPFCTGHIGLLGTKPSWDLMQECDTLLVVGCSFPYAEFYPKAGQAKGVQIDIDGRLLSLRYPMDVNLKGDARQTLAGTDAPAKRKTERTWQEKVIENVKEWWKVVEGRAHTDGNNGLLNPERVFWELSPRLPDRCIISADSGTTANWFARDLKIRRGHDGQRQRQSRDDGGGGSLCRRGEILLPRSRLHCRDRRRRDADERAQRLHYRRPNTGRSGPTRAGSRWC